LELDAGLLVPPQSPAPLNGAEHGGDPAVAWYTEGPQLDMRARELGARTDPDDEAALGDAIEGSQGMRQREGVAE
jgi:hypothetical protein